MSGLDLTHQFQATPERVERVRARPGSAGDGARRPVRLLQRHLRRAPRRHARCAGARPVRGDGADPPDICSSRVRAHVVVETHGEHTRGMTVIDRRHLPRGPDAELHRADRRRRRRRLRRSSSRPSHFSHWSSTQLRIATSGWSFTVRLDAELAGWSFDRSWLRAHAYSRRHACRCDA